MDANLLGMVLVPGTILLQKSTITTSRMTHGEEKGSMAPASELARYCSICS
jgi:hypothetical protein